MGFGVLGTSRRSILEISGSCSLDLVGFSISSMSSDSGPLSFPSNADGAPEGVHRVLLLSCLSSPHWP